MDKVFAEQVVQDMRTIQDMIRWSMSRFNDAGIYLGHGTDNTWDEAVALVLHSLHLPPDIDPNICNARLTNSEKEKIVELVMKRVQQRIPVPYLTNRAWFAGLEFYVDERVLIPRSPFAELIHDAFQPWIGDTRPQRILDLCTGSGCMAIAAAYAFPEAEVDAVDLSEDALAVADMNIHHHGLSHQVIPIRSDLFTELEGQRYDVIMTNPPYVDAEDMADLPDEFTHEPEMALAAGEDGLDLVETILHRAPAHLAEGGWLFCEVGNSLVHMQTRFPDVPFVWLEFANGGDGVFAISREDLVKYHHCFKA